jgi:LPPG:FO 2-phospho-L-lactate transferase
MVDGLAQCLPPEALSVIINIGDDFDHLGLRISPDLDTVCYNLAGIANPETGWGRQDETWHALESLEVLGGPDWFRLGDRDLGTHLERTRRLRSGESLSEITRDFCREWGIRCTVLPASDDAIPTFVITEDGELSFQDYFVRLKCEPRVTGFRFANTAKTQPAPGVLERIEKADTVIFCPSNPWVSIDPILAIPGIRSALAEKRIIAITPIIGGQAVKGPAAKMFAELGFEPSASAVSRHYQDVLSGFVLDAEDRLLVESIRSTGQEVLVTDTLMSSSMDRRRLAVEVLAFGERLRNPQFGNNSTVERV